MYRKVTKEAGKKEGHRRRVKEIRPIVTLKLTHAVDNRVFGVGNKLKEVDDKMDVIMEGTPGLSATNRSILIVCVTAG